MATPAHKKPKPTFSKQNPGWPVKSDNSSGQRRVAVAKERDPGSRGRPTKTKSDKLAGISFERKSVPDKAKTGGVRTEEPRRGTPQDRADIKKRAKAEADRKAKVKKMDNAGKEKSAKLVDKGKKKIKPKLKPSPSSTPQGRANKEKLRKAKIANFNVESEAKLISKKSKKK